MDFHRSLRRVRRVVWRARVALAPPGGRALLLRAQGARVGEGCFIFTKDLGTEPYLVSIGDRTTVAGEVLFITHDGATRAVGPGRPRNVFGRIDIGADCFIGARAILLPGTRIGDHSVVGAGAVVRGDVPAGVVVAGAPARVVETLAEYEAKARERALHLTAADAAGVREQILRALAR